MTYDDWRGDPNANEMGRDICQCGHVRAGHHRKCNGHVGKFWCNCREFVAVEAKDAS